MQIKHPLFTGACLALLITQHSFAREGDTDQPMVFKADLMVLDDKTGNHIYTGNVSMTQGSILVKAERLEIFHKEGQPGYFIADGTKAGGNKNNSTEGRAVFQQTTDDNTLIKATAKLIEYNESESHLTLSGHAELSRDRDLFKGHKIDYNTEHHRLIAGKPKSSNASENATQDRVQVIIYPKSKSKSNDKAATQSKSQAKKPLTQESSQRHNSKVSDSDT